MIRRIHLKAFGASCVFHGLLISLLVGLAFLYRAHLPPSKNGSAPSAPSIMLSTLVIISPPPAPAKPPAIPPTIPPPVLPAPPANVVSAPPPPEQGAPVLVVQPSPAPAVESAKISAPAHPAISHTATATTHPKTETPAAAPATTFASSYASGPSVLPHPPYPSEAHDLGQTGTVIMNVQFDAQGGVAQVEVAQSSGVAILDSSTRSFIRAHWRSPAYAGQTVSVPVEYKLENL